MRKLVFLMLIISSGVALIDCFKPEITIYNETDSIVLIFFGTGEKYVEPDYQQVKQSRRSVKIPQGKSMVFSISVSDFFLNNGQVYIGWQVGGLAESSIKRVAYNTFDIIPGVKYCSARIDIKNSKDETYYTNKSICFRSLGITSNAFG